MTRTAVASAKTILIIDDNVDLARSYSEILNGEGFHCRVAGSGKDALALLQTGPLPELILLDCLMPGMSGEEFVQEFRRRFPAGEQTWIVGFSSFYQESPLLDQMRPHVRDIVEKPNDVDEFLTMVSRFLSAA